MTSAFLAAIEVGHYISVWKTIPLLLVLLVWARLLTWADKDAPAAHLPRVPINAGLIVGGVLGFALFFLLPVGFVIAFPVLLLVMLIEAGVYLGIRHQKVGLSDLGQQFKEFVRSFTAREKAATVKEGQVQVLARSGQPMPVPEGESPDRPGYDTVQSILTDPLKRESNRIELAPGDGVAGFRYFVDGVGYSGGEFSRTHSSAAIAYLKQAAGLDVNEKRKPQRGELRVVLNGKRREMQIETKGSAYGEQLRLCVDPKKRHTMRLEEIGLTNEQLELMRNLILDNSGVVLVAAPPGHGLKTTLYAILRAHDAFLTHIHTIERDAEQELEGITLNRLDPAAPAAEEVRLAEWVTSQMPDVIMMSEVRETKSARALIEFAAEGRRVYIGMRAVNTFDAITHWRKLVGDDRRALKHLRAAISGRPMRKLCAACKVAYTPDAAVARKLNLSPEKAERLYQARVQPLRDPKGRPIPCEFCHDLRYKGRVGVYETFLIDEEVRQLIVEGGSLNQIKAVFRKQRGRFLQERALALVEAGETSIQEVLRVLKGPSEEAPRQQPPPPAAQKQAAANTPAPGAATGP